MPSVHQQQPERAQVVVVGDVMTDVLVGVGGALALGTEPAAVSTRQGGAGANVAHWLAHLGVPVAFVGAVGADPFGREAVDVLAGAGVDVYARTDAQLLTGTCVVLVDERGERTMLPDAGANSALRAEGLPSDTLRAASWLHLSGYTLLNPGSREAGLTALRVAQAAGVPTSIGAASSAPLQAVGGKEFLRLSEGVHLAFCTLEEAEVLCGSRDPATVAARLTASYDQVVLNLEAAGALWCSSKDVVGCRVAAARPAGPVVDGTGAGDAFSAAYLAAVTGTAELTGIELREALVRACALAAEVVSLPGSRPDPARKSRRPGESR